MKRIFIFIITLIFLQGCYLDEDTGIFFKAQPEDCTVSNTTITNASITIKGYFENTSNYNLDEIVELNVTSTLNYSDDSVDKYYYKSSSANFKSNENITTTNNNWDSDSKQKTKLSEIEIKSGNKIYVEFSYDFAPTTTTGLKVTEINTEVKYFLFD